MKTSILLRSWNRRPEEKFQISIYLERTMHKSHTKFTYPSKLQLVLGMENFVMCKIVEQTSKPQG
jgi:hypothetical protein